MLISDFLNIKSSNIPFMNISPECDNKYFIDPSNLKKHNIPNFNNKLCLQKIENFLQTILGLYKSGNFKKLNDIINNIHELNSTHIGYGSKNITSMGRGPSFDSLKESLNNVNDIYTKLSNKKLIDIVSIFSPNFGKDSISDLITNIIYEELSNYTLKIAKLYNKEKYIHNFKIKTWNVQKQDWIIKNNGTKFVLNGYDTILIPKDLISKSKTYLLSASGFVYSVLGLIKQKRTNTNKTKNKLTKNDAYKLVRQQHNNVDNKQIAFKESMKNPSLMDKYIN
ncbi:hypothetical protein [Apilactobacillus quenuiae]|uniref:hypothetical protein n=1 Tax=Apilactobacillus quenuiae TaxID=2008377 RepID=UPI000D01FCC2|nr:hypothetical protein [Apilactobacillus quenuiae]